VDLMVLNRIGAFLLLHANAGAKPFPRRARGVCSHLSWPSPAPQARGGPDAHSCLAQGAARVAAVWGGSRIRFLQLADRLLRVPVLYSRALVKRYAELAQKPRRDGPCAHARDTWGSICPWAQCLGREWIPRGRGAPIYLRPEPPRTHCRRPPALYRSKKPEFCSHTGISHALLAGGKPWEATLTDPWFHPLPPASRVLVALWDLRACSRSRHPPISGLLGNGCYRSQAATGCRFVIYLRGIPIPNGSPHHIVTAGRNQRAVVRA